MSKGRCYGFVYTLAAREDRRICLQTRDGVGLLYLTHAVAALGYPFARAIMNYPAAGPEELIPYDYSCLRENDLLVLATRPPVDDVKLEDKRASRRSFTTLEDILFKGPVSRWFEICGRSQVALTPEAEAVSRKVAQRQTMMFFQNGGASYKNFGWRGATDRERLYLPSRGYTPAFLIYEKHAWPGGPGFLAAFGMGGPETLGWCRALATRFPHLLCTRPFVMAEMRAKRLPARPDDDFSDPWDVTILDEGQRPASDDAPQSLVSPPPADDDGGIEGDDAD